MSPLPEPPPAGARPTIVVADDASEVRLLIRTRLRLSGAFDVVGEAGDGAEAVEVVARLRPALLLLDVSMPRMDGLEALRRVRDVSPVTSVVMFSGFDEQGLAERAMALGAAAFVEKSTPVDELIAVLTDAARRATARRPGPEPPPVQRGPLSVDQHILDEHLERFREVFDQAAIGMATMTLAGTVVRANEALARLLRAGAAELVGRTYAELTDGRTEQVDAALARIRAEPVETLQLEHGVPGGSHVLLATFAPVRDSLGRPLYVFLQVQDVTAERAASEELRRSEERFRLLVAAVEDYAIFMLDPTGLVVSWNAGAERSQGYVADEIIGRHFSVFYPPDVAASGHCDHELELALREGHYEEEGWRLRKDGTRYWANVVITAVHDGEGRHLGFAKVTRDTSDRRRLAQEREQALVALEQANAELEALNTRLRQVADDQAQFLAVTAHELRTPVGVLGSSADLLGAHWEQLADAERRELLGAMGSSTVRLRRLLEDLLTASRLQASSLTLHPQHVELAGIVSDAVATVCRAQPSARVVADVPAGLVVDGDRDRLSQAVENLLTNSLRHGVPPVSVVGSVDPSGTHAQVRVSDQGEGVPPAVVPRLFERFASGAGRGGTGLGLYIVRELARAHGGEATYEPSHGGGRPAFVVTLPLVRSGSSPSEGTSQ